MVLKYLFLLIFPVVCAYANEAECLYAHGITRTAPTIMRVAAEQADAIQYYDGERLYLKAEKIYHTNAGPALCNGYTTILLPNLSANQLGYYLKCRNKDDYYFRCPNPKCGHRWWFSEYWDYLCPKCGTPGE